MYLSADREVSEVLSPSHYYIIILYVYCKMCCVSPRATQWTRRNAGTRGAPFPPNLPLTKNIPFMQIILWLSVICISQAYWDMYEHTCREMILGTRLNLVTFWKYKKICAMYQVLWTCTSMHVRNTFSVWYLKSKMALIPRCGSVRRAEVSGTHTHTFSLFSLFPTHSFSPTFVSPSLCSYISPVVHYIIHINHGDVGSFLIGALGGGGDLVFHTGSFQS